MAIWSTIELQTDLQAKMRSFTVSNLQVVVLMMVVVVITVVSSVVLSSSVRYVVVANDNLMGRKNRSERDNWQDFQELYVLKRPPCNTHVVSTTLPGHTAVEFSLTANATQYWFDWTFWLKRKKAVTDTLILSNEQFYLSTATAQRICEPTWSAVGVHVKETEYNVLVFWVTFVLKTIGNESVAISLIITPYAEQ